MYRYRLRACHFLLFLFLQTYVHTKAVVTAQDMNTRKTAEQLDAVASFVERKNFPEHLGRRIRRHFRHVYSLKTAIDENKIFTELSTSLRAEVSDYLLEKNLGQVTLFRSMSRTLWPRLLPQLRPVHIDREDLLCSQGEDVTEMFVVLTGMLTGSTVIFNEGSLGTEDDSSDDDDDDDDSLMPTEQTRRILPGGAVNILTAIGVWDKAVETVRCVQTAETYALSQVDYVSIFTMAADRLQLDRIIQMEVANFKMDQRPEALEESPTRFGRPVCLRCLSELAITVVDGRNLTPATSRASADSTVHTFVVVELIDRVQRKLLNTCFFQKSQISRSIISPAWDYSVLWTDIAAPFDMVALRIRVFDCTRSKVQDHFLGNHSDDLFLGQVVVSLEELERSMELDKAQRTLQSPVTDRDGGEKDTQGDGRDEDECSQENSGDVTAGGSWSSNDRMTEKWYTMAVEEVGGFETAVSSTYSCDASTTEPKQRANASNARKRAHHSPQVLLRFSTKRAEITDFRVLDKKAGGDLSRSHSAPSVMKRSHSAPSLTDLKGKLPHTPLVASDVHALRKHRGSFTDNHHNSSYQLSTESMTHKHSSFSRGNILDENPLRNSGSQRYEASL